MTIYVYFQFRDYLTGPKVNISYPTVGSTVYGPEVEIRGTVQRVVSISLNDSSIFTDPSGGFKEKLMLNDGYNIIKLVAKDRFGKTIEKLLEFIVTSPPQK